MEKTTPTTDVRVLLVDDDAGARRGIGHYLKGCLRLSPALRVEFLEAGTCTQALEALHDHSVGAVFLDYHMPDMDGLECLSRMLELDPDLPVTLLTGEDSAVLAGQAIRRGACDYVVKSEATVEEIHRTLWKGMEWSAMRRKLRSQGTQLMEAENQRVMMESLAGACHRLGQPATVLQTCLALIRREKDPVRLEQLLDDADAAAIELGELLKKMEGLRAYRTESYLPGDDHEDSIRMVVF